MSRLEPHRCRRAVPVLLASCLAVCLSGGRLGAEPPHMLGDFAPGSTDYSPRPSGLLEVGGITVYTDGDPAGYNPALWRTDGTAAGTRLLSVLVPPGSSAAQAIGTARGHAFYSSYTPWASGDDLRFWATDGTAEGTALLTLQPLPGRWQAAAGGAGLFFTTCEQRAGCSFWSSDGTLEGTARRGSISAGNGEIELLQLAALERAGLQTIRVGDRVELLAIDPAGGVQTLRRFRAETGPRLLTAAGDRAFFLAPVGGRLQLWTSDGTPGGTRALTRFPGEQAFASTYFLEPIGGSVYFLADDGSHGVELWAHDGTPDGGRRVTDFKPPQPFDVFYQTNPGLGAMLGRVGGSIVFPADGGQGFRLWTTRGTLASTRPLRGCPAGCPETRSTFFARLGNRLMFAARDSQHGRELWTTDGTGPGTRLVADLTPGPSSRWLRFFTEAGRLVVFQIFWDEYEPGELWVTDGTARGTRRLALGGPGDSHYHPEPANRSLDVGVAGPRAVAYGFENDGRAGLWASDGSAAGTGPIRTEPLAAGSNPTDFAWFGGRLLVRLTRGPDRELTALGGGAAEPLLGWVDSLPVLTKGRAAVHAYPPQDSSEPGGPGRYEIWGTDGTPAGTVRLLTEPHLAPFGPSPSPRWGAIFLGYPADDEQHLQLGEPVTLYQTDATPAGTRPLLELPQGMVPYDPVEIGGRLYFHAYEYDRQGFRVWTSDGTAAGTVPLFAGSTNGYHPPYFSRLGNAVFFLALGADGFVGLWRTAGTPETTTLVARLADYEAWNGRQFWYFEVAAGKIYFWAPASPEEVGPLRPWVSDGTAAGTRLLAGVDLADPPVPFSRKKFVAAGARVFFAADDGLHGNELWSTDGTPAGTALAADLWPGPLSSDPRQLTSLGGELALVAQMPAAGAELAVFAPCTGEARVVADVAPGPSWSEPTELLWSASRGTLVFSADDGLHGREPWGWEPGSGSVCP